MLKQATRAKKIRNTSTWLICLTLIYLLIGADIVPVAQAQKAKTVENIYQEGLKDFNSKRWQDAIGHFRAAYRLIPSSEIAYCISRCYKELRNDEKASEFAKKALNAKPRLKEEYRTDARKICEHADRIKKILSSKTLDSAKIDLPSPPPSPPGLPKITVGPSPPPPRIAGLTGTWKSNKNGIYFIRQIGSVIWWYGESSDDGKSWANVFRGTMKQNNINGIWADVPKGRARGSGKLRLQLEKSGRLKAIGQTGAFRDTSWTRYTRKNPKVPVTKPKPVIKPKKVTPTRR